MWAGTLDESADNTWKDTYTTPAHVTRHHAPQSTERVSSSFEFTRSSCKAKYNIVLHPLK